MQVVVSVRPQVTGVTVWRPDCPLVPPTVKGLLSFRLLSAAEPVRMRKQASVSEDEGTKVKQLSRKTIMTSVSEPDQSEAKEVMQSHLHKGYNVFIFMFFTFMVIF